MWIRALCMIKWTLLSTSSRMAVDENRATAQCYFVISVKNGAVLYGSCEPCRASSSGRCSHVVAFHFNEIAFLQIQIKHIFYVSIS